MPDILRRFIVQLDSDVVVNGEAINVGAITCTTIDTGQGANEVYPQNQALMTTSDVVHQSVDASQNVNGSSSSKSTNANTGSSAKARFLASADACSVEYAATSSTYSDITGAADCALINANNASGGIQLSLDGVTKAKLNSSGIWVVNGGISFDGGTNVLDNYVDSASTWAPTITFDTPGDLSISWSSQVGLYVEVGDFNVLWFELISSTFTHTTASGSLRITGAPNACRNVTNFVTTSNLEYQNISKASYTQFSVSASANSAILKVAACAQGQNRVEVTAADLPSGNTLLLRGFIIYPI